MLRLLMLLGLLLTANGLIAGVMPLTAKEVSLMLRSGYSNDAVLQELKTRKFADPFDSDMEKEFVKAGANQSLIDALRAGSYQLSSTDIALAKEQAEAAKSRAGAQPSQRSNVSEGAMKADNAASPANPPPAQEGGTMYDHLKDDLVYWHDGSLVPFDNETLERKKFYLLFFSAIWSKEGRQFTARLIDYYGRVASQHPEVEVIFFSADRSAFAMENYVSQTNMPWPAVAYDKLQGKAGALAGSLTHQIPRLILAEGSGRVLSDSGETRPDFDKVLADVDKVLAASK
jgi:hypothetical protein